MNPGKSWRWLVEAIIVAVVVTIIITMQSLGQRLNTLELECVRTPGAVGTAPADKDFAPALIMRWPQKSVIIKQEPLHTRADYGAAG